MVWYKPSTWFAVETERRRMTWWAQDWEEPIGTVAGEPVTDRTILGLSAAYAAVGLISDSISTLPVDVFTEDGERRVPVPKAARPRWLDRPGGGLSRIDFLNQIVTSLLVHGEALILTPRDDNGQVAGLVVMEPAEVQLSPEGIYSALGQDLSPFEILHIRGLMLPSSKKAEQRGIGPIKHAREAFAAASATQKFGSAFFGNGAWTGQIVEVPGSLSEDGQKALKAYINDTRRGAARAHKIGVLVDGAKISRPITFSPEDSQFLQTREFQVSDIARMFRVPPEMIGGKSGDSLTYATLEGRSTHFVKFSLLHWIVRIEEALTALWHSEDGSEDGRIKLNVNGLLRGSTKERYESYAIAIDKGWLTVDEVRALEDLPPRTEEGDQNVA